MLYYEYSLLNTDKSLLTGHHLDLGRYPFDFAQFKANKAKVFDPYHLSLLTLLSRAQYEGGSFS